jgi:hypothetical protein
MRPLHFVCVQVLACSMCAGCQSSRPEAIESDPDLLYPFGTPRQQIIQKRPGSGLRIIVETLPDDEFLVATVRQMLAQGMARPTYYEKFPVLGTAGAVQDYIFYDRHQCVMYVARRT